MSKQIVLSNQAAYAVMRSVLTGPNCQTTGDMSPFMFSEKEAVNLSSLAKNFDEGPDSFLSVYAVLHKKRHLDVLDVVKAYCLDHIVMVQVADSIFVSRGSADPYFSKLLERGFSLTEGSLPAYLYSCIGKPGRVELMKDGFAKVVTHNCMISGVVLPEGVKKGDWVAMHFATAITVLSKNEASEIELLQKQNDWFSDLTRKIPGEINYRNFCDRDLSTYAADRCRLLNKNML